MTMRARLLLLSAVFVALAVSSVNCKAWGRLGHATINKIAEDHLTKKAKAEITKYMHGESIVTYASYPDDYRARLDKSFRPAWNKSTTNYIHSFEVDKDLQPFHGCEFEGRPLKNSVYFIDGFINDLKNAPELVDSVRFIEIAMLCHFIGDMHCPTHIRYQPKRGIASWPVTFLGGDTKYHVVWDSGIVSAYYPWSYSDFAAMCDICDADEIAGIVTGDIYDWAHDSAVMCKPIRKSVKEGDELTADWAIDRLDFARSQIRKAGYRLAHELNLIFDPRYARKYEKQIKQNR